MDYKISKTHEVVHTIGQCVSLVYNPVIEIRQELWQEHGMREYEDVSEERQRMVQLLALQFAEQHTTIGVSCEFIQLLDEMGFYVLGQMVPYFNWCTRLDHQQTLLA